MHRSKAGTPILTPSDLQIGMQNSTAKGTEWFEVKREAPNGVQRELFYERKMSSCFF
jgi:hypothetical protein